MGLKKKGVIINRGLTWERADRRGGCGHGSTRSRSASTTSPGDSAGLPARTSHWSRVDLDLVEICRPRARGDPSGLAIWEVRSREEAPYSHERPVGGLVDSYAEALAASPAATAFSEASSATYRKVCAVWVTSAKQDVTHTRRMTQLIECCAAASSCRTSARGHPKWVERAAAAPEEAR